VNSPAFPPPDVGAFILFSEGFVKVKLRPNVGKINFIQNLLIMNETKKCQFFLNKSYCRIKCI
jgi:hypothetical protein